ncbi:MAG: DUF1415 domain-containing protein [Planctomycetes bacterium]|nr:DUF1415 domain-containing protein [Planctomycetota bacterium]
MADPTTPPAQPCSPQFVVERTRRWVQDVVIGLGLCPFAQPVVTRDQVQYIVSAATSRGELLVDLEHALRTLVTTAAATLATTLLIHPQVLGDFLDYNDFLDDADALLKALGLAADVQIASFHPRYRFADTEPEQIDNFTNRSPYPMLHLLRQASVAAARATHADIEGIPARNIATMRNLDAAARQELRDAVS